MSALVTCFLAASMTVSPSYNWERYRMMRSLDEGSLNAESKRKMSLSSSATGITIAPAEVDP